MRLTEDSSVFAVIPHINPTIEHYIQKTGGSHLIEAPTNASVAGVAVNANFTDRP